MKLCSWSISEPALVAPQSLHANVRISFFEHLNPMNQILSDYYRDPKNHLEMLREDPMLVCTIIAIAARYCRLPGHASRTRGMLVHNTLFRHIQNCVSRVVWGIAEEDMGVGHAISFIESLLLLINWVK